MAMTFAVVLFQHFGIYQQTMSIDNSVRYILKSIKQKQKQLKK